MDLNVVAVVGRLTKDMEVTYSNSGFAFGKISLANNYRKKVGDEWIEEVSFLDLKLFGKIVESLAQYLVKSKMIAISGKLRQQRWTQDGQKRSRVMIEVDELQLLGGDKAKESDHDDPQDIF